jgi:hypothetical protein
MTEMPRRRSRRHGELENLVGVVDYFQREARKAAGGAMGGGELRPLVVLLVSLRY